ISDGSQLIQLWSVNNELVDCDYDEDKDAIDNFLKTFATEVSEVSECKDPTNETCDISNSSITIKTLRNELPPDLSMLEQRDVIVEQCRQLHERIRFKYTSLSTKAQIGVVQEARRKISKN
ncbi:uncharacterized protein B4U79_15820, partial [Dinothrombium tinctorium]